MRFLISKRALQMFCSSAATTLAGSATRLSPMFATEDETHAFD
jgi:hypothetical protein